MRVPVKLGNGAVFYVDAETDDAVAIDPELAPRGAAMGRAEVMPEQEFSRAVRVVQGIAAELTEGLLATGERHVPAEIELELQIGFTADGSVFFVKAGANATLKLNLTWKPPAAK